MIKWLKNNEEGLKKSAGNMFHQLLNPFFL